MSLTLGEEWHISKNGYDLLNKNPNTNSQELLKLALDTDLKEICSPVLSTELSKERTTKIVLQIQKLRNISAPKSNEETQAAPRMLKLSLTDGELYVQALELLPLNFLNREKTPPGTKILINNAKVLFGYLLLTPNNCSLLGGRVPSLIDKWEVAKSVMNNQRKNSNEDGPPPWVNFGSKIQSTVEVNNFKSLEEKNRETNKTNSEFELQRQGAIAEASTGAIKKVFSGRVTQNIQPNQNSQKFEKKGSTQNRTKPSHKVVEGEDKPLEKVSLFSFLENKLPAHKTSSNETSSKDNAQSYKSRRGQFENDYKNHNKEPARAQYSNEKTERNTNSRGYYSKDADRNAPKQYHNQKTFNNQQKFDGSDLKEKPVTNTIHHHIKNTVVENRSIPHHIKSTAVENKTIPHHITNTSVENKTIPQHITNRDVGNKTIPDHIENTFVENKRIPHHIKNTAAEHNKGQLSKLTNGATSDPPVNKEQKNIDETSQLMTKMSLNSQFASRSLRQHLNLGIPKQNQADHNLDEHRNMWNIGDACMAKYWEDGKFYNAKIVAVTNKTIVVKFSGYGNIEEVLSTDCIPVSQRSRTQTSVSYSGSMVFRRS